MLAHRKTPEVLIGENQYKKTGSSYECRFFIFLTLCLNQKVRAVG